MRFIATLGWYFCVSYATIPLFWFLIHPCAKYWRARKSSPYGVLVAGWIVIWIAFVWLTAPWRHIALYTAPWLWIFGGEFLAGGLMIYGISAKDFSAKQLGGLPEVTANHGEQRLATSGIRSKIRHPIYLGHLFSMLGWSIGTGLAVCYALTAFAIVTGAIMIRMEDRELEQRFGEEYRAYRQRVPAVFPRLDGSTSPK